MSEVKIYCFSGTGNPLHVTKELQKRIPETSLIRIVSLLNKDITETDVETVGFVFPIHGMTVPIPVKKFITKLDLNQLNIFLGWQYELVPNIGHLLK
jgi:hypothetical protein